MFARVPGFPDIGRTVPAALVTALGIVVGVVASILIVGVSGWLIVSFLLLFAAAALPRGPFVALVVVQLAFTQTFVATPGYTGLFALLLFASHLLFTTGSLSVWLPRRARVQLEVLRRPALRFVAMQVPTQVVAFIVLSFIHPLGAQSLVWLGIVGAASALALALTILAPALLRPAKD